MRMRRAHFSIGGIRVSLLSDCRSFVDEYLSLYAPYRRESADGEAIAVEIRAGRRFPWRRGPYLIRSKGADEFQVLRRREVLPHLEWIINWQIIQQRAEYVQFHAATLETGGQALILPGNPGCGKSTLTAGLLARGFSYLCDEFALIQRETLAVHPFPRALCMKESSFPVVDRLGLPLRRKVPYRKPVKGRVAFLNPRDIRADIEGQPSPVRWIVFPQYTAGATPALEKLPRSEAAFRLARQCFNFPVHQQGTLTTLAAVVRQAECYQLVSGDIQSTCDLVESVVSHSPN
jgi:HprK-related kinase A